MSDQERGGILFKHFGTSGRRRIEVYEELGGYRALRKALTEMTPDQVVQEIDASGLRGRGGAGFPTGKKASFLPHGDIDKYLCCNADESEPGAFKDRELMHRNPHQLIEGIIITAYGAGIRHAFIYIRGEYREQAEILERAIAEAYGARLRRRQHPGLRLLLQPRSPPRRRRLHLRRGDGAARLARGQAREPAPEAAVSRPTRASTRGRP